MSVCDDSVETNLMQIRRFQLQHLIDTRTVDFVGGLLDFSGLVIDAAKGSLDQFLAVLVEQIKSSKMSATRDLDQLSESVPNLGLRKGLQETEVEEGVHGRMVGTQSVLIVAIVDSNLDTDAGIDQTNHSRGNTDEVRVPSICSTCKTRITSQHTVLKGL